jgi:hypothetical protein
MTANQHADVFQADRSALSGRRPPQYLYKYRGVDADALAMLASDKVYLSRLDAFNDPFESLHLDDETIAHPDRPPARASLVEASLRVCSLSEDHQDLLMWGHYADRHRGFCIRFDFTRDPKICKLLFPVEYKPTIPEIVTDNSDAITAARVGTLVKADKWSYEREWRIIGNVPEDQALTTELFLDYAPEAISGIIFGVRMSDLHKTLIRKLLRDHSVNFMQAVRRDDSFALAIEEDRDAGSRGPAT